MNIVHYYLTASKYGTVIEKTDKMLKKHNVLKILHNITKKHKPIFDKYNEILDDKDVSYDDIDIYLDKLRKLIYIYFDQLNKKLRKTPIVFYPAFDSDSGAVTNKFVLNAFFISDSGESPVNPYEYTPENVDFSKKDIAVLLNPSCKTKFFSMSSLKSRFAALMAHEMTHRKQNRRFFKDAKNRNMKDTTAKKFGYENVPLINIVLNKSVDPSFIKSLETRSILNISKKLFKKFLKEKNIKNVKDVSEKLQDYEEEAGHKKYYSNRAEIGANVIRCAYLFKNNIKSKTLKNFIYIYLIIGRQSKIVKNKFFKELMLEIENLGVDSTLVTNYINKRGLELDKSFDETLQTYIRKV
jgi:hypothetical protein